MNTRWALYLQAIRGPVLLMTVGVLFAVHQAGVISFARTWPLLIIVIGVMKLLERAWAPATPAAWPAGSAYQGATQYQQSPPYTGARHANSPVPPRSDAGSQAGGQQQ